MRLPEIAYRFLYPKDVSGPTFELESVFLTGSGTAASLTVDMTGVPIDRVLCVTNMQVSFLPGVGGQFLRGAIFGTTPGGVVFNIIQSKFPGTDDLREDINWDGEIYIGGSGIDNPILSALGVKDDAIVSSTVHFSVFGVVIPRGNIAPF